MSPERLSSISHNSVVLLGTQGVKPRIQQRVFVRGITHSSNLEEEANTEAALQKGDLARFTVESDDRELKLRASAAEYQKWAAPLTIVTGGADLADGRELKLSSPRGAEAS